MKNKQKIIFKQSITECVTFISSQLRAAIHIIEYDKKNSQTKSCVLNNKIKIYPCLLLSGSRVLSCDFLTFALCIFTDKTIRPIIIKFCEQLKKKKKTIQMPCRATKSNISSDTYLRWSHNFYDRKIYLNLNFFTLLHSKIIQRAIIIHIMLIRYFVIYVSKMPLLRIQNENEKCHWIRCFQKEENHLAEHRNCGKSFIRFLNGKIRVELWFLFSIYIIIPT